MKTMTRPGWKQVCATGAISLGLGSVVCDLVGPRVEAGRGGRGEGRSRIERRPAAAARPARPVRVSGERDARPAPAPTPAPAVAAEPRTGGAASAVVPAFPVPPDPNGDPSWRDRIGSAEAGDRVEAVDQIPQCPGADGESILEGLMASDPDAYVRERSALAYTQVVGRRGVPTLRRLALSDRDENVGAAARASLHLIDSVDPLPPRGTLEILPIGNFSPGEWIQVTVRLRSFVDVSDARFSLQVPAGFQSVPGNLPRWRGPLAANQPRELTFGLRTPADLKRATLFARLKLDFAEQLDLEVATQRIHLKAQAGEGSAIDPGSLPSSDAGERVIELPAEGE